MWVYTGPSLQQRLLLNSRVGFFLDYWLSLHAEDAHPFRSARPLSLQSVVRAVLDSTSPHDATLRAQLKRELKAVALLAPLLRHLPSPPAVVLEADPSPWSSDWLTWCARADPLLDHQYTVPALCDFLATAISTGSLAEMAYFSRRVASEVSGADRSNRQLFTTVKAAFCDSAALDDGRADLSRLQDVLASIFSPRSKQSYQVHLRLAPAALSSGELTRIQYGRDLVLEADPSGRQQLAGIVFEVLAADPENALRIALSCLQPFLDQLRLRFYVRTHVFGAAKLIAKDEGVESWIALPQPFWTKKADRRGTPRVPPRFETLVSMLAPVDQTRWRAARWHLSQAFADWPEDSHSAAAHCWLAIECFAPRPGKPLPRVQRLADPYLVLALGGLSAHLAGRVAAQSHALHLAGKKPDWHYRLAHHEVSVPKWMNRILDERSPKHYSRWRSPEAPSAVFDPAVGVLQAVRRRLTTPAGEQWMDARVRSDLALLYGLRNKAVHAGARIFPSNTAAYLGRLACEVVLTLMSQTAAVSAPLAAVTSGVASDSDAG